MIYVKLKMDRTKWNGIEYGRIEMVTNEINQAKFKAIVHAHWKKSESFISKRYMTASIVIYNGGEFYFICNVKRYWKEQIDLMWNCDCKVRRMRKKNLAKMYWKEWDITT